LHEESLNVSLCRVLLGGFSFRDGERRCLRSRRNELRGTSQEVLPGRMNCRTILSVRYFLAEQTIETPRGLTLSEYPTVSSLRTEVCASLRTHTRVCCLSRTKSQRVRRTPISTGRRVHVLLRNRCCVVGHVTASKRNVLSCGSISEALSPFVSIE